MALEIPVNVTTKADFDKWLENDVGDKLSTTQKNALRTDIAAKLGLDMGNAITAYGRAEINKDVQYLLANPTATSIPNLDADPKIGDANGPNQFNSLWARANQFSDPFLIDLTSVLALMHQTSEKLRSATKELREAENMNQQAQMQAAADDIRSQGMFQAIAGAVGAALTIGAGAMGIYGASKAMKSTLDLHTDVKQMKTEFSAREFQQASPSKEVMSGGKSKVEIGGHRDPTNKTSSSNSTTTSNQSTKTTESMTSSQKTTKQNEAVDKDTLRAQLQNLKTSLNNPTSPEAQHNNQVNAMVNQYSQNKFMEIQTQSQYWGAYSQMLDGTGKAMAASFNGVASGFEADKALMDKQAAQAGYEKEVTSDLIKTLSDFSQQIRQTVAAIIQSQDQAANKVASV